MRQLLASFMLIACASLLAQEDCDLFNIQELSDAYLNFQVDTIILQPDGSFEVQLSNGTTFTQFQGCTDPAYDEYDASANTDDGSCTTPVPPGCTDPAYTEYNASANIDDGSCATSVVEGCIDPAYTEYNAAANTDDGSCVTLVGCSESDFASMDGYNYNIVQIGDQCWFAENLQSTVYADGTSIPLVTDDYEWGDVWWGARCDYGNNESNVAFYGRLYNKMAVDDSRGLCPSGWHVPSDEEWTVLSDFLGGSWSAGALLKASPDDSPAWNGTNETGFSAQPGGYRYVTWTSTFLYAASYGFWWSSSPNRAARSLWGNSSSLSEVSFPSRFGLSVRCLRDAE